MTTTTGKNEASGVGDVSLELQRAVEGGGMPDEEVFRRWAESVLSCHPDPVELVIRLVDEAESRQLNRDYRGKDRPTNVLSFPFEAPPQVATPLLGDLVICAPVVAREAQEQSKSLQAHWAHMVIHGLLHLLGYDHQNDQEALQMESRERELMHRLNYPDPYTEEDQ
jgi:probable rRNA maturation factor